MTADERAMRSFFIAVASVKRIGRYCDALAVGLQVDDEGRRWSFSCRGNVIYRNVAFYYPQSGWMSFGRGQYEAITITKGVRQVLRIIRRHWGLSVTVPLPRLKRPNKLKEYMRQFAEFTREEERKKQEAQEVERKRRREVRERFVQQVMTPVAPPVRRTPRVPRDGTPRLPVSRRKPIVKKPKDDKWKDPFITNISHASWQGRIADDAYDLCSVFYRSTGGGKLIRRKSSPFS